MKKLNSSEAADVPQRDIAVFVLLQTVTLGVYWFYICYQWSKRPVLGAAFGSIAAPRETPIKAHARFRVSGIMTELRQSTSHISTKDWKTN